MNQENEGNMHFFQKLLVVLVFLAGMMNSRQYLEFLGLSQLYNFLELGYYCLLAVLSILTVINILYKKVNVPTSAFSSWILLFIAVISKLLFLFIQFPRLFLFGQKYFTETILYFSSFLLIFLLLLHIKSLKNIKSTIIALGLGASFSTIIPIIFFPEMIASRISVVSDTNFYGSFWNASVIAFMTVGWLLIAHSNIEVVRWKRIILNGIFILFTFGSLAGLSRASFIAFVTSIIIYMMLSNNITKYLKLVFYFCVIASSMYILFPEIIESLLFRFEGGISIEEETRSQIWKEYLRNIKDYLWIGEMQGDYRKYSTGGYAPHSVLLNWLTQFGIMGLIGFVVLLFNVFNNIRIIQVKQSKRVAAALYAWLGAYLSIALINETGFDQLTLFAAIGIILAWGKEAKKTNLVN